MISGSWFTLLLVLVPIAGGFIGYFAGRKSKAERNAVSTLQTQADSHFEKESRERQGDKNKNLRDSIVMGTTMLEFVLVLQLIWEALRGFAAGLSFRWEHFGGLSLSFSVDGLKLLLCALAAFLWMGAACFSREYFRHHRNRNRFYLFFLWTLGAVMGVFLAADLFTLFLFFEMMSLTSYVWVAQEEDEKALKAAGTYLAIAVIGGLAVLMGLFLLYDMFGTLDINALSDWIGSIGAVGTNAAEALAGTAAGGIGAAEFAGADGRIFTTVRLYAAGGCLLAGFGAKAGMVPLHIWLPKSHPVAPAPASALLSGMLTKTGVYGIVLLCVKFFFNDVLWNRGMDKDKALYAASPWGTAVLIFAMVTMVTGALLAVFSTDLKRTLACSSMSQIGFILCGASMVILTGGEEIAAGGTVLHIVNHALIKLVLFLSAGAVYMRLHKLDLNEIRGYGRDKPFLKAAFAIGALSISGVPLFGGYISKTLLHESVKEYMEWAANSGAARFCEVLFIVTGGLTLAYMLKLFIAIFVEKPAADTSFTGWAGRPESGSGRRISGMSVLSAMCIGIPSLLLFTLGILPHVLMDRTAALTQDFFGNMKIGQTLSEVSYFSFANLTGALWSVGIGLAVYFGMIRTCLMKKDESGVRIYKSVWPKWLDLEELVYRPVLMRLLPFLFGVVCRVFDRLTDGIIAFLRKTVFAPKKVRLPAPVGTRTTYLLGTLLDDFVIFLNRTFFRKKPIRVSFVNLFAVGKREVDQTTRLITRSVSFGLLMFCIGLCLTLTYLLFYY